MEVDPSGAGYGAFEANIAILSVRRLSWSRGSQLGNAVGDRDEGKDGRSDLWMKG